MPRLGEWRFRMCQGWESGGLGRAKVGRAEV